jgi:predicted ester cyclase
MTALLFTAIVLIGFAPSLPATAQDATPAAECPAPSAEENAALARRVAEERYVNPAVFTDLMSPDVAYHRSVSTEILTNAEGAQRAAEFKTAFPDVQVTAEFVTATDDTASVAWVAEGTHQGEFDGVAPTGRRATWEGISLLRIECGRVVEFWNQTDALELRRQLGIVSDEELSDAEPAGTATPTP